jgi:hypothetical protein
MVGGRTTQGDMTLEYDPGLRRRGKHGRQPVEPGPGRGVQ